MRRKRNKTKRNEQYATESTATITKNDNDNNAKATNERSNERVNHRKKQLQRHIAYVDFNTVSVDFLIHAR